MQTKAMYAMFSMYSVTWAQFEILFLKITREYTMDVITDWSNTLVYLGLFFVVKKALGLLGNIYDGWRAYVLPYIYRLFKNENFTEKFGGWAVVTGCTGGIGREYALGLARKGMNLVLVSRSKQKLEDLEQEIVKTYKVNTMVIVADFTQIEALDHIVSKLRESKVDIGVLVNNVGILGPHFQPFLEFDKKTVKDMIAVNISATTVLCHELLPDMVKKGKGAIINIASTASYLPGPYLAEYFATKHYIHAFTEAIAIENEGTGVIIQEVDPGHVATEMTKNFAPDPTAPLASTFVASALETLGYSQRTMGYWVHGLMMLQLDLIPSHWLRMKIMKMVGKKNYRHALEKNRKSL